MLLYDLLHRKDPGPLLTKAGGQVATLKDSLAAVRREAVAALGRCTSKHQATAAARVAEWRAYMKAKRA